MTRRTAFRALGLLILCAAGARCIPAPGETDPRTLPWVLTEWRRLPDILTIADVDRDGDDELLVLARPTRDVEAVGITQATGAVIDQINIEGAIRSLMTSDLDGDGIVEILIPFVRRDSLFVTVADPRGRKLRTIFLVAGAPRVEPDGVLPWDPVVRSFHLLDVDGDGSRELVTTVVTPYARAPRGVLVHAWPGGAFLGASFVGSYLSGPMLVDLNADGRPEMLFGSTATNNGAEAGGLDDRSAWLAAFELGHTPRLIWSRSLGATWQVADFEFGDFDGDDRPEILAVSSNMGTGSSPAEIRVEFIEPGTWLVKRQRSIRARFGAHIFFDRDGDGTRELLVARPPDEIWVLNSDLDIQERVRPRVPGIDQLQSFPDIDGDGRSELAVVSGRWMHVHSPAGRPLLQFEGTFGGELRIAPDQRPLLVASTPNGTIAYRISRNWLWPLYRWGPGSGVALALLAGTVLFARLAGQRRQLALLHHAQVLATDEHTVGVAVLDRGGSVRWLNPTLERWTAWRRPRFRTAPNVQAFGKQLPALADFCRSALGRTPATEHARTLVLDLDGGPRECEVHARPFHVNLRGDPHWFIRIDYGRNPQSQTATTWMLMARSVAHGLKNPLTGVLLTLQRLQMEYRERAPAVANRLDRYTTRIEDGIEELRQLTGNFLKFVNLEAPQFESTDLNGLVGEVAESLRRTLPPDTRLHLRLAPDLAAIEIDRDQIRALLDNLVSNAVQAMPDGGTVTLSTGFVSGVRWSTEDAPRDFLKLEVLDTGVGVPPHLRVRVFEPGFTTREDGTGLGLAIVAKIVGDHDGRVTIEGAVGTGSAFVVHLPIHHNPTGTGTPDAGAGRAAG